MLKLVHIEFLKLRRRKFVFLMMLAANVMPFFAMIYFKYFGNTGVDPIQFYKWSSFGYTFLFILPFVLGMLCTMLMYSENQNDMQKQLWIVPVSKMGYFFSKFFVVLIYSICFMLMNAASSVVFSVFSGSVIFEWGSVRYLLNKCLEIGVITAFAMLPILSAAASQKGYILPVCITLVYVLLNFFIMPINMYLHPLSSLAVIIARNRDIPGIAFTQVNLINLAFLCIFIWGISAVILANIILGRRK